MIDLTDFSSAPREAFAPRKTFTPQKKQLEVVNRNRAMKPIDSSLVDPEMAETLERESRQPESLKKHLWKPNDFEDWAYNEESIAKKRAELGIKDPDEVFKDAPVVN